MIAVYFSAPLIQETHPSDNLDIDFLYCQGAPYLLIKSTTIKFQAIQTFNRISKSQKEGARRVTYKRGPSDIIKGVEKLINLFRKRGLNLEVVNADNEFQKLDGKISAHLEICASGQHVSRIERAIRTIKDRVRCFWVSLPFKRVPKIMIDDCLVMVISCLNDFPNNEGISTTISPAGIVLGRGKIDGNHLKATFGRYYEVFCGTDNTNKERRTSAICLRPSNSQGGYYFMSLETGKRIHGYKFTELTMPDHVIDRVHQLATNEFSSDLDHDGCPIFEWEVGAPIIDNIVSEQITSQDNNSYSTNIVENEDTLDDQSDAGETDAQSETDVSDSEPDVDNRHESEEDILGFNDDDDDLLIDEPNEEMQESRSEDEEESITSEHESDISANIDEASLTTTDEKARSEVDTKNIIDGKRTRRQTKYYINMLNVGEDAFQKFKNIRKQLTHALRK